MKAAEGAKNTTNACLPERTLAAVRAQMIYDGHRAGGQRGLFSSFSSPPTLTPTLRSSPAGRAAVIGRYSRDNGGGKGPRAATACCAGAARAGRERGCCSSAAEAAGRCTPRGCILRAIVRAGEHSFLNTQTYMYVYIFIYTNTIK